jgi:hypothetical protein
MHVQMYYFLPPLRVVPSSWESLKSMQSYKKSLKYWTVDSGDSQVRPEIKVEDVTNLRCVEDLDSLEILDETGRVVAEFGPGKEYEGWMLTVEHPVIHQATSSFSLIALQQRVNEFAAVTRTSTLRKAAVAPEPAFVDTEASFNKTGTGLFWCRGQAVES